MEANKEIYYNEKENILFDKLKGLFSEYLLSDIQSLAAFKFIKDQFSQDNKETERLKKWVLMKINNKSIPEGAHQMQLGCPDLVPCLTVKNFWDAYSFDWVKTLAENISIIREELTSLRDRKGFQPYKSPNFASDIKVDFFYVSPKITSVP